jgi:hypothetical protein
MGYFTGGPKYDEALAAKRGPQGLVEKVERNQVSMEGVFHMKIVTKNLVLIETGPFWDGQSFCFPSLAAFIAGPC